MISVRCPSCGKVVGFDESDGGLLVACPHCREPFFVPSVARPVAAPGAAAPAAAAPAEEPTVVARLPQAPALPEDISLAADPDLDPPAPEALDDLLPAEEEAPPPPPDPIPEPEAPPQPDPIPNLELDPEPEPVGTPAVVRPTDVAPSLSAAASLSEDLPPAVKEPEQPADVLDEVTDEAKEDERFYEPEPLPKRDEEEKEERRYEDDERDEDEPRPRRRAKARQKERRRSREEPSWDEKLTRNRVLGGAGVVTGGLILLGTLSHHLMSSQSAWHPGVCCGDVFALGLSGVGLYYLIRG